MADDDVGKIFNEYDPDESTGKLRLRRQQPSLFKRRGIKGRVLLSDDILQQNTDLFNWVRRERRSAKESIPAGYVPVWDKGRIKWFPNTESARAYANDGDVMEEVVGQDGKKVLRTDRQILRRVKTVDVDTRKIPASVKESLGMKAYHIPDSEPEVFARTKDSKVFLQALEGAAQANDIRTARDVKSLVTTDLGNKDWEDVLRGAAKISERNSNLDFDAVWSAAPDHVQRKLLTKYGSKEGFLSRSFGALTEKELREAKDRGIYDTSNPVEVRERLHEAARMDKHDAKEIEAEGKKINKKAKAEELGDLTDLMNFGIGETSIQKMRKAGITLEKLRSGQVSEDQLKKLGGFGDTKLQELKDAGIPLIPSASVKRPKGRPPKNLFGKGADPFASENARNGDRVRNGAGDLVEKKGPGRIAQAWDSFTTSFEDTIAKPFKYVQQYRNTQANAYVREAKKVAQAKEAASYLNKVQRAKGSLGVNFARVEYVLTKVLVRTLIVALVLGPLLFLPFGILQFAGWIVFGLAAFIINGAYLIGLSLINVTVSGFNNAINSAGFLISNWLQSFLDYIPKYVPAAATNSPLPGYTPIDLHFNVAQVLDPNLFFPDCVNTNTMGAIGLHGISAAMINFGDWLATHGPFAVGFSILLFLALPVYFISRGTSIGLLVLGLAIITIPALSNADIPLVWAIGIAVGGLALAGAVWWMKQDIGPFALFMTLGLGIAIILGGFIIHDAFAGQTDPLTGQTTGGFNLNFGGSIHLSVDPLAETLGNGAKIVGAGAENLANLVTSGWAHALDKSNIQGLKDVFNIGGGTNPVTATPGKTCTG